MCCSGSGTSNFDPVVSTAQFWSYTVTGLEPDTSELVIPLPSVRATNTYGVLQSQGHGAFAYGMLVDDASKTTAHFVLSLTYPATAGDVFWFTAQDPT